MAGEPWRYRCPEGHATYIVRRTRGVLVCKSCGREYQHRLDAKTGELVSL